MPDKVEELYWAALRGHHKKVTKLLAEGVSANGKSSGRTILGAAIGNGRVDIVRMLLEAGASPLAESGRLGMRGLHLALAIGTRAEYELVREYVPPKKLRALRTDPEYLQSALTSGHTELVVELLDAGQDVNHPETRPLMSALRYPHLVGLLLDRGADVNGPRDWHGNTALLIAAGAGHSDTVRLLLARGADPNATSNNGHSLLRAAAAGGLTWLVEERLDAGDPVDGTPESGSPILAAIGRGRVDVVRLLIDRGANLQHEKGHFGLVTMAKVDKQPEIVEMLIKAGAPHTAPRPKRTDKAYSIGAALRDPQGTTVLQLERIPPNPPFSQLPNLKHLRSPTSQWHPEIGHLTKLRRLNLGCGRLTTVGPQIGRLTDLRQLFLHGNEIKALPAELFDCVLLTELDLGTNALTKIPPEIAKLRRLAKLYLPTNKLTAIPAELGSLTKLRELCLANNKISTLPTELTKLTKLEVLDLWGNPIPAKQIDEFRQALPNTEIKT